MTQDEHNWLKAVYDKRYSALELDDLDPNQTGLFYVQAFLAYDYTKTTSSMVNIEGYKKIAFNVAVNAKSSGSYVKATFLNSSNEQVGSLIDLTINGGWTNYYDIPEGAILVNITSHEGYYSYGQLYTTHYSLLA